MVLLYKCKCRRKFQKKKNKTTAYQYTNFGQNRFSPANDLSSRTEIQIKFSRLSFFIVVKIVEDLAIRAITGLSVRNFKLHHRGLDSNVNLSFFFFNTIRQRFGPIFRPFHRWRRSWYGPSCYRYSIFVYKRLNAIMYYYYRIFFFLHQTAEVFFIIYSSGFATEKKNKKKNNTILFVLL